MDTWYNSTEFRMLCGVNVRRTPILMAWPQFFQLHCGFSGCKEVVPDTMRDQTRNQARTYLPRVTRGERRLVLPWESKWSCPQLWSSIKCYGVSRSNSFLSEECLVGFGKGEDFWLRIFRKGNIGRIMCSPWNLSRVAKDPIQRQHCCSRNLRNFDGSVWGRESVDANTQERFAIVPPFKILLHPRYPRGWTFLS